MEKVNCRTEMVNNQKSGIRERLGVNGEDILLVFWVTGWKNLKISRYLLEMFLVHGELFVLRP